MPEETLQPHETAVEREIRGFTYKQFVWAAVTIIGGLMSIEATILTYSSSVRTDITLMKADIVANKKTNDIQDAQLSALKVDLDLLRLQVERMHQQREDDQDIKRAQADYNYQHH